MTAVLGVLLWLALITLAVVLAFKLGALGERSRWLVLVRQAAELRNRTAGMNRMLDDSVIVAMQGWRCMPRRDEAPAREPFPGPEEPMEEP